MTTALHNPFAETVVLVPAAGEKPTGSSEESSALAVVAGKPVIQWSLDYLHELGFRHFHVGVPLGQSTLSQFLTTKYSSVPTLAVHHMDTAGPGDTLATLLSFTAATKVLVVLGDTFVEFRPETYIGGSNAVIMTQIAFDSSRWCQVSANEMGRVVEIRDKESVSTDEVSAAVGVYYFPDRCSLVTAVEESKSLTPDCLEISSILRSMLVWPGLVTEHPQAWFDGGHSDLRWSSTKTLLSSRSFNRLEVNERLGTVTKRSDRPEKLIDEINYLRLLPTDLAPLFPRLIDFCVDLPDVWVTQEFYAYPTLAEYFLFHSLDDSVWHRVFQHLRDIVCVGHRS